MNTIKSVQFKNYKRLKNFSIKPGFGNILVGPNNSGKSSILDAFRILEAGLRYSRSKKPALLNTFLGLSYGYDIPETYCPFHLANAITNYGDDDAIIEFEHNNSSKAYINISENRTIRFFIDSNGKPLATSKKFRDAFPVNLVVVPTLSPLESEEFLVREETVRRNRTTRLAARNFRNIWNLEDKATFERFQERVQRAWTDIKIQAPELVPEMPPRVEMYFEENRVTREVQWAGFGFQVWLQIHTHLIRGDKDSILILDEPDVYLHPDLQHRLYHDVKEMFGQYFIATHATEIINVADTSEIFVIEPQSRTAKRVKKDSDYDAMLNYIGSAENADFAKIVRVKKVLFVEGQDAKILRKFSKRLNLENLYTEQKSPIFQLGGFSQWKRAESSIWAFKNLLDVEISTICLFDRDYRSSEEILSFVEKMNSSSLDCSVLKRKEIENYLLSPRAISKAIINKKRELGDINFTVNEDDIKKIITNESNQFKNNVSAQTVSNYLRFEKECNSKKDNSTIIGHALINFEDEWNTFEGMRKLVPGKELLRSVIDEVKRKYKVSVTISMIQDHMNSDDIGEEMCELLQRINIFFE